MARPRTVAAFDFDGTLTRGDTLLPFLRRLAGPAALAHALARDLPRLARIAAGGGDRDAAKALLLARLLAGRPVAHVNAVAAAYAEDVVRRRLRPTVVERLGWHRGLGHQVVVVSASPEPVIVPVARRLDVDVVLATRLEVDAHGRLTGRLVGANVRADEKVARLEAHLGAGPVELWAYGDSAGDDALLAAADHGFRVSRSSRLVPVSAGRGTLRAWPAAGGA